VAARVPLLHGQACQWCARAPLARTILPAVRVCPSCTDRPVSGASVPLLHEQSCQWCSCAPLAPTGLSVRSYTFSPTLAPFRLQLDCARSRGPINTDPDARSLPHACEPQMGRADILFTRRKQSARNDPGDRTRASILTPPPCNCTDRVTHRSLRREVVVDECEVEPRALWGV
jgi:hypothetical protein